MKYTFYIFFSKIKSFAVRKDNAAAKLLKKCFNDTFLKVIDTYIY